MTKQEAKQRIEKLKRFINQQRYQVHVLDRSDLSAVALDSLKKELFDLENSFPDLVTADSPTQRVAGVPLEKFDKVEHTQPMLSLQDAFSEQDILDWEARITKLLSAKENEGLDYFCELKFDGLAVELIFREGLLTIGATRGNGLVGEDVTCNLKTIEAIPLSLRGEDEIVSGLKAAGLAEVFQSFKAAEELVIRGEALISKKEFAKINQQQMAAGLVAYANPRNIAAGSIRQLDSKITAQRKMDFYAWDLVSDFGQKTHEQEHLVLKILGFKIHPAAKRCSNIDEVIRYREYWLKHRDRLPFEIDGVVVQVNNNKLFDKLGVAGKSPRAAIAFKFPLREAQTMVQNIIVQVGRTGAITPLAILKPVAIGGVTVSRATLHNEDEIQRLGLKIGDTVIVGRAGDVIPDILRVLRELRTGREKSFKMPHACPVCGTPLVRKEPDVIWRCPNQKCKARQRRYFYYFVGRAAFDIDGLGPQIINQLLDYGLLSDPADLFTLQETDLLNLERFAEKSAHNLVKAISAKKRIRLSRFIYALGIEGVGEETAQDLANIFRSLRKLRAVSLEDLLKIKDIGPKTAKNIHQFFRKKDNIVFLEKLFRVGVKVENTSPKSDSQKLSGQTFVLTGTLSTLERERAKEMIRRQGGNVSESVSSDTDFVVVGENPGSKFDKAKKLGVKIINETEFLAFIE
ncbi:MAG: NAD-dependent DNA ligase LigA [Candidatus Pacebacteria bacterium]|nr:NAD-dependent DNA ligase LigA [Candidatus Paceibacterota bacterium]